MYKEVGIRVAALAGAGLLVLSVGFFQAAGQGAPAANWNADVQKIADAYKKGDAASAQAQVAALAKKAAKLEDVKNAFKLRDKGGLGVGTTPGKIVPDGIELKLLALGRGPLAAADLANQADALEQMAFRIAVVADVTALKPQTKVGSPKATPQNWAIWAHDMRAGAVDLIMAARKKDAQAIQAAAVKLNASCTSCHDAFKP